MEETQELSGSNEAPKHKALWLGGMNGTFIQPGGLSEYPAVLKLGQAFESFQNSPYRGEWNQRLPFTFGEVRDLLLEVSRLIEHQAR